MLTLIEKEAEQVWYLSLGESDQAGKGERGLVDLAHKQPFENHRIELATCSPDEEFVQLHNQLQVNIFGFGSGALRLLALTSGFQIDTLSNINQNFQN